MIRYLYVLYHKMIIFSIAYVYFLQKISLRRQFLCTPNGKAENWEYNSALNCYFRGQEERKTGFFDAANRPVSVGNILTLPTTLTGLKRNIFLGTENRTGEIIACPVPEYSPVCHNCFGQRVVNKFISDYPKRPVFTALNLKCFLLKCGLEHFTTYYQM